MSVPKKKRTPSHVGNRRSHHALTKTLLVTCSKCGKAIEPHKACAFCGAYKGREILKIKDKKTKSVK